MRIVLIGQAAFGARVLEALIDNGEEVAAAFAPPEPPGRPEPLREAGEKRGVRVYQPKRMREPEALETVRALKADLGVMAFVTDIVPQAVIEAPRLGTIQYHPSLLPKHRGGSAINWPIIMGETRTGLTIFWPDAGIDTGPILLQKEVEVDPDDTVGSLYFNKLFPLGVEAMLESVALLKQGRAPRIPQDESQATYEKLCEEADVAIDWRLPAQRVYNLIRGGNPQPGANTPFRGAKLKIFDSALVPARGGAAGEVLEVSADGIVVAAAGGGILVKRVQPAGGSKAAAAQWAQDVRLGTGERLGS